MPQSSRAGGGTGRQICLSVSEFFGVPPLASSTGEPVGPVSMGVFFLILLLDKQKKYARRRAKVIWWTTE